MRDRIWESPKGTSGRIFGGWRRRRRREDEERREEVRIEQDKHISAAVSQNGSQKKKASNISKPRGRRTVVRRQLPVLVLLGEL